MTGILRAELLKMRRSGAGRLTWLAPFVTAGLGWVLSGNSAQLAAYNWWYVMILPMAVTLWAASAVTREQAAGFQNLLVLPISQPKLWLGKMGAAAVCLLAAHAVLWLALTAAGALTLVRITSLNGLIGCGLLFLTTLWQIPFGMLLVKKLGQLPGILLSIFGGLLLGIQGSDKPWFLFDLYAIPARVVCPFFGIHPNGLPLEPGSPLLETGLVVPAVVISLLAAIAMAALAALLLGKGEKRRG